MNLLALLCAFVCFLVSTLLGFDVLHGAHLFGWLSLGLLFVTLANLLGGAAGALAVVRALR